jgi:hypothetical protein
MRTALLISLVAAIAAACRASDADASRAADSARVATSPALGGACSAMSRVSRGTLRIVVGRSRATTFAAPAQAPGTWQGCRLVGNAGARADSSTTAPDVLLRHALATDGWTPDPRFDASGAHTTQFGVRRAGALCVVATTMLATEQSGAASATTAPGAPYRLEIRCTEGAAVRS